ncbi:glutathione ABC transporter substrate-binding protein [Alkalicoccobacillus porphyridii]|uniref:Glutathione ABC transporter substrate-binding protein n=1 Tax=Alkalicoccobacillus porphyridii TaxID=2597270 RepID=A0A554A0S3_9BACI|nr:glutathione ABC transporter substrate-binding protein [Alkalicoccobacillus porphyridii]TSB47290.1 glutathione ABC transporter substrate-binding protein [Alkalicoccobacillus porphyridii]
MRVNKTFGLGLFALSMSAAVMVGCSSDDLSSNESEEGNGGGGDLVVDMQSDAVSLDVHGSNDTASSNVTSNIFETLVTQDENLELQPGLAEDWEQISETEWEFQLREGVTFHDGTEFDAEAVKANLDRVLDPEVSSPRAFLFEMIEDIEIVDPYTVRFTTEYPFAPLAANLAHYGAAIMSPAAIEEDYQGMEAGDEAGSFLNENPIGTGYFTFDTWNTGQSITLNKNEDYWGDEANVDTVTFQVIPEGNTRIANLETGASHIANNISSSDLNRFEQTEGIKTNQTESVGMLYLGFNKNNETLNDPLVREGLSLAINRAEIVEGIFNGVGVEAKTPLAPKVFGHDDSIVFNEYDLERAKELLAEAGYEDGLEIVLNTSDQRERQDIAAYIQSALVEIGVTVSIETTEWGSFLDLTSQGESELFILSWSTVNGDADMGLYPLFHTDNQGAQGNRTFTSDEQLDDMLEQARMSEDENERLALYNEIQTYVAEDSTIQPLIHEEYLVGLQENVQGFWQSPTGVLVLHDVSIQ